MCLTQFSINDNLMQQGLNKTRILSSLLFSGALSIPGKAAATRRNSWETEKEGYNLDKRAATKTVTTIDNCF